MFVRFFQHFKLSCLWARENVINYSGCLSGESYVRLLDRCRDHVCKENIECVHWSFWLCKTWETFSFEAWVLFLMKQSDHECSINPSSKNSVTEFQITGRKNFKRVCSFRELRCSYKDCSYKKACSGHYRVRMTRDGLDLWYWHSLRVSEVGTLRPNTGRLNQHGIINNQSFWSVYKVRFTNTLFFYKVNFIRTPRLNWPISH